MPTAITFNPLHEPHDETSHVERATRLQAITAALDASGLRSALLEIVARPASDAQILAVHEPRLLEMIRWTATQDDVWLGMDTYTTRATYEAARMAAGAAIAARHAMMTFSIERVAIVDYDVHHGNGTQDIFYDDGQVLFCSSHASPLYPGTGDQGEVGLEGGYGTTLNLPLPYRTGDSNFIQLYDRVVLPALRRFDPQLMLISAGYDGHWDDPLGPLSLSISGYAALTQRLLMLAGELCGGKIALILEGGYSLPALSGCVAAALRVLLGRDPGADPLGPANTAEPDISTLISSTLDRHPIFQG